MRDKPIDFESEDCEKLEAFLVERVYEFNAQATGRFDAQLLGGAIRNDENEIIAAISGHTWAGSCHVTHLWVHASHRGSGLGRKLLVAAEAEASQRGCTNLVLSTHSFQAPGFYERLGYQQQAVVYDHPVGHSSIFYAKILADKEP